MEKVENKAAKALGGEKVDIDFGEWNNVKEKMIVSFRGKQGSSACRVYSRKENKEECLRGQVTGTETQELTVFPGDRVYAQAAYIQFRSANEISSPGLQDV
jgi:uncharacterized protein YodC (DUF2158 family)